MSPNSCGPQIPWSLVKGGVFTLDADYWARSGGILEPITRLEEKYARIIQ